MIYPSSIPISPPPPILFLSFVFSLLYFAFMSHFALCISCVRFGFLLDFIAFQHSTRSCYFCLRCPFSFLCFGSIDSHGAFLVLVDDMGLG